MNREELVKTVATRGLHLLDAGAITVCVFTTAGFFGFAGWAFDLLSNFRLQYFVCLLLCVLLTFKRQRVRLLGYSFFALLNLAAALTLYFPGNAASQASPRVKLLNMNLEAIVNHDYEKAVHCVRKFDPDIITLQEVNSTFANYMTNNLPEYRYVHVLTGEACEGVGILSKLPLEQTTEKQLGLNFRMISTIARTDLGPVQIAVAHPLPPLDWVMWEEEDKFFKGIAEMYQARKTSFVVIGDLNATTYGYHLNHLKSTTHIGDSTQGFGIQLTWPVDFMLLGIDIDHCLFSNDLAALTRKVGPNIKSDHKPLYVELSRCLNEQDSKQSAAASTK